MTPRRATVAAIAGLLLAGAARAEAPAEKTEATGPAAATLRAAAEDITRQVAALRGLEPRGPVAKGVLSRAEIGVRLKERIAKEYTPAEIKVEARVLKRLGLLPADADYERLVLDLLMEQVAGFYDPFTRTLYIADWLSLETQRPALAHEIQHALQDQHFNLKTFIKPIKDDGDRQLARSALVEGDGMVVMMEFIARSLGIQLSHKHGDSNSIIRAALTAGAMSQPVFNSAPRFLRETLLFPYTAGMDFVFALRGGEPWKRVDEGFRSPPDSTEQVLHPEKYLARERPAVITPAPLASLSPRRELRRDVLGELEWRVLLASAVPEEQAERAAAGWGGDRLVAFAADGDDAPVVVLDLSSWDTVADAAEAEAALRALMAKQTGRPDPSGSVAVFTTGGEAWSVERRGRSVLAIFGAPIEQRAPLGDEVWRTWKVADPPRRK